MECRIDNEMNHRAEAPAVQRPPAPAEPVMLDAVALLWRSGWLF